MEKVKITTNYLKRIVVGSSRKIADSETPNLQVWVGAKSISFYLVRKVDGRQHNINLGRWPEMMLEEARQAALQRLSALVNYDDIDGQISRRQPTIGEAIDNYIERVSPSTKNNAVAVLERFAAIRDRKIVSVSHEDIVRIHEANKGTPCAANRAVKYLCSAINRLSEKIGQAIPNPAIGVKYYPEQPRDRFLERDESPRFFAALAALQNTIIYGVQADAIMMMLLTGARKNNVCKMMLEEILETGMWIIPKEKFKGGKTEHKIQLGPDELAIIEKRRGGRDCGPVFMYRGHALADVRKTVQKACVMAGIKNFHSHDCRRTLGTWMLSSGATIAIVSKKLGHRSIATTEKVYAHMLPDVAADATAAAVAAMKSGNR